MKVRLWDCLDLMDWTVFKHSVGNLDEYTNTVTDFISKCVEGCVPKKSIWVFPNRKPWMKREIHSLLKATHVAFVSDNPDLYRKSRCDLHKAIKDAKMQYRTKLEVQTNHMDSRCLWQSLNNITGYKMKQSKVADNDTSLPEALNAVCAWFEQSAIGAVLPCPDSSRHTCARCLCCRRRIGLPGSQPKESDGLGVHGCALRSRADQLVE
eukprot:g19914.t1